MFWIIAAALMGLTCLALLSALGKTPTVASGDHDRMFYEAQLKEIERQKALLLIGEAEAEAARTEAARRLLAASANISHDRSGSATGRKWAAIAILTAVPVIALPAYLLNGVPDMPSFPIASRKVEPVQGDQSLDIAKAVAQIEGHLARNPEDGRGHEVIAPVYGRMGRHGDAAKAYRAAIAYLGPTADRHAALGEALATQANGTITSDARQSFEAAAALDPEHVKAQFFLALAAQQDGDISKAVRLLSGIESRIPDSDLKTEIKRQLALLGAIPKGGADVAAFPAPQQAEAIRSMVDGLAQRLATSGGSVDEWARLVRALTVLGDTERAQAILQEARQKFSTAPEQLDQIEKAAKVQP